MIIEKFKDQQAEEVSKLIRQDLLEIISKDYPQGRLSAGEMEKIRTQHTFVAVKGEKVLGTASLANFGSQENPKYYGTSVFVALEFQGRGVGKQLMEKSL